MVQRVRDYIDPTERHATEAVYRYLDTVGDGTGQKNARAECGVDIGDATFDYTGGAAEDLWSLAAHNMLTGQPCHFDAVGTGASPFVVNTTYWAIRVAAGTFQLASSAANAMAGTQIEGAADSAGAWSVTVGEYASTPVVRYFYSHATKTTVIHRMLVSIEDATGMKPEEYGATGGALTNGMKVHVTDSSNTDIVDLTDSVPVTTNAEWGALCYDVDSKSWGNTPTNELVVARWTFPKAGKPLILGPGERFMVTQQDNLLGLVNHKFMIQGYTIAS